MKQIKQIASLVGMLACLLLVASIATVTQAADKPVVKGVDMDTYRLAWHDEFDGNELDTTKWYYRRDSGWASKQQSQNVTVVDGKLRIALKKEDAGNKHYTAGGVISKRSFGCGYYEARFKLPTTQGWHTSFWMSSYDDTKPNRTGGIGLHEFDVCEQDSFMHDHYSCNLWMRKPKEAKAPKLPGYKHIPTPDLSADFHVWGCKFTPTTVRYFFDGEEVRNYDISAYQIGDQQIWLTSVAANIGKKTGDPVDAELPAYAEFDYVRFYEKK